MRLKTTRRPARTRTRFNSRTPCGVRRPRGWFPHNTRCVSIHAPRAGCDSGCQFTEDATEWFQFTHPVRGATLDIAKKTLSESVSIHAPRAGCDLRFYHSLSDLQRFNSRTPCGVRQGRATGSKVVIMFQFTHPVRGATMTGAWSVPSALSFNSRTPCGVRPIKRLTQNDEWYVSIHAPRAGCDS